MPDISSVCFHILIFISFTIQKSPVLCMGIIDKISRPHSYPTQLRDIPELYGQLLLQIIIYLFILVIFVKYSLRVFRQKNIRNKKSSDTLE